MKPSSSSSLLAMKLSAALYFIYTCTDVLYSLMPTRFGANAGEDRANRIIANRLVIALYLMSGAVIGASLPLLHDR